MKKLVYGVPFAIEVKLEKGISICGIRFLVNYNSSEIANIVMIPTYISQDIHFEESSKKLENIVNQFNNYSIKNRITFYLNLRYLIKTGKINNKEFKLINEGSKFKIVKELISGYNSNFEELVKDKNKLSFYKDNTSRKYIIAKFDLSNDFSHLLVMSYNINFEVKNSLEIHDYMIGDPRNTYVRDYVGMSTDELLEYTDDVLEIINVYSYSSGDKILDSKYISFINVNKDGNISLKHIERKIYESEKIVLSEKLIKDFNSEIKFAIDGLYDYEI